MLSVKARRLFTQFSPLYLAGHAQIVAPATFFFYTINCLFDQIHYLPTKEDETVDSFVKMVNRIARLSAFYREKEFKKLGLGEMHHAYILTVCGEPGISQEELACKIFVNKSNVARQAAQLEQKGFILRQSDTHDARKLRLFPTEKAQSLAPEIREILRNWNQTLLDEIPSGQQAAVLSGLQTILEKAEAEMCKKEE